MDLGFGPFADHPLNESILAATFGLQFDSALLRWRLHPKELSPRDWHCPVVPNCMPLRPDLDGNGDMLVKLSRAENGNGNLRDEPSSRCRSSLAQLSVSDEITPQSRAAGHKMMAPGADLLERARANGPMQKVSMGFLGALMTSVAETTMDFMTHDPANAKKHSKEGFDALWRMLE